MRSSSIERGLPGRNSSCKPAMRRATKRRRHLPTVAWVVPKRRATALLVAPAAQARTVTRQITSPTSSATSRAPSGPSATPTGSPIGHPLVRREKPRQDVARGRPGGRSRTARRSPCSRSACCGSRSRAGRSPCRRETREACRRAASRGRATRCARPAHSPVSWPSRPQPDPAAPGRPPSAPSSNRASRRSPPSRTEVR